MPVILERDPTIIENVADEVERDALVADRLYQLAESSAENVSIGYVAMQGAKDSKLIQSFLLELDVAYKAAVVYAEFRRRQRS
jgi:hypothetical protein